MREGKSERGREYLRFEVLSDDHESGVLALGACVGLK